MQIAGVIIAGGKGTRLGGDKPLHAFGGATLLHSVIARTKPQVDELALNVSAAGLARYRSYGLALLNDVEEDDIGPLAGILAGLQWVEESGALWLATFPADTPFLPRDLVSRLLANVRGQTPVAAHDGVQLHGLCAVWPTSARAALLDGVRNQNVRSLREALEHLGGCPCEFDGEEHAFFNVNTPEDLAKAERILANMPPA